MTTLNLVGLSRDEARRVARSIVGSGLPPEQGIVAAAMARGISADRLIAAGLDAETVARAVDANFVQRSLRQQPGPSLGHGDSTLPPPTPVDDRLNAVRAYLGADTPPLYTVEVEMERWLPRDDRRYSELVGWLQSLDLAKRGNAIDAIQGLSRISASRTDHQDMILNAILHSQKDGLSAIEVAAIVLVPYGPTKLPGPEALAQVMGSSVLEAEIAIARARQIHGID